MGEHCCISHGHDNGLGLSNCFFLYEKQCRGRVVCLVAVYIVFNMSLPVKTGGVGAIEILPIRKKKGGGGGVMCFFYP